MVCDLLKCSFYGNCSRSIARFQASCGNWGPANPVGCTRVGNGFSCVLLSTGNLPLAAQWEGDEDMGHGFFVPIVAAYIAWTRRDELLAAEVKPNYWGIAILAYAAFQLLLGTLGAELFLQRTSLIITIAGCVLLTCGTKIFKILAFPMALLLFMVPIPRILYTQITFPLQLFASRVAEWTLSVLEYPGAARRKCPGTRESEAIGSGSLQRHSLAAFAFIPISGVRIFLRFETVDAVGIARLHDPDCDSRQCRARDYYRAF